MWKPTIIFIDFLSDSSNLIHVLGAKSFAPSLLLLVFSLCQVILLLSVVIIDINILHGVAPSYLKDLSLSYRTHVTIYAVTIMVYY